MTAAVKHRDLPTLVCSCGKECRGKPGLRMHQRNTGHTGGDELAPDDAAITVDPDQDFPDEGKTVTNHHPEETPPVEKRSWKDRIWGKARGDGTREVTRERKPRVTRRRQSAAELLGMAYGGLGSLLVKTEADVPVGRTLQIQAPVAGPILDKWLSGTIIDRVLQPFVAKVDDLEDLAALVMLPILVGTLERSPDLAPMLEPMARQAIRANLVHLAAAEKKRKANEAKYVKALEELEIPDGDDPVTAILQSIFRPPESTNGKVPQEAAA